MPNHAALLHAPTSYFVNFFIFANNDSGVGVNY